MSETTAQTPPESKESKPEESPKSKSPQPTTVIIPPAKDPPNAALSEPDALAIVLGESTTPSVHHNRKKDLLTEARVDRRKWLQQVPLPFESWKDPDNFWTAEDRLAKVHSTMASQRMPAMTKVFSELYGMEEHRRTPEEVADRLEELIGPLTGEGDEPLLDVKSPPISKEEAETHDSVVLKAYHDFWTTLQQPECALLVQGMRNFMRSIDGTQNMERVAALLKSYLDSTYESLKSHVAWKDRMDEHVRRSLESLMYGHCQPILNKLEWGGLFTMTEEQWIERFTQLQFVEPSHLEIECLVDADTSVSELLAIPMEALLSMDRYFSPYEKLQRVLAVYRGVNAALSSALNPASGSNTKLPSADDVLPAIILTVLHAKPANIFRNLQLVEVFCPPEYLRGEAGYAYTNLYGAVQFLQDLDMDTPSSLSISPEDFRKGLEECKVGTEKKLAIITEKLEVSDLQVHGSDISAADVRAARMKGEVVNLDWALKWQHEHAPSEETSGLDNTAEDTTQAPLPEGFSRSYSFLTTEAEDIRVSDLPQLLADYKMLVHTTEQLLGERAARYASEKRRKKAERKDSLDESFMDDEESTT